MTSQLSERLARKVEPVVRRGLAVGEADCVRLYSLGDGEECELWSTELDRNSKADELAAEIAGLAEDEHEQAQAYAFRVRCYHEGEVCAELTFRTRPPRRSADVIGEELHPKGESVERSLTRQSMRQAETYARILASSVERREATLLATVDGLVKQNSELASRYFESLKVSADAMKQERAHEIDLLRVSTEQDAIKEGINLLKEVGPKVAGYFTGENILAPLVGIVAKLEPDQIKSLVALGTISEAEGDKLIKAAAKAREALSKAGPKALPANGKGAS